jgi:SGNH hydrolase-like domain, acetyltransferase AlgX
MTFMRLRVLLPAILAATFVADGVTRAMPVTTWSFRAWEGLTANNQPTTAFEPLGRFDAPNAFGDLANMGNLPWMRVNRRETFTIDAYGFRNPPGRAESGEVSVLLLGDSFAAGSGVADELTLSGQLTSTWGHPTYTLAPMLPRAATLTAFAKRLRMKPGAWVVHQQTYAYNESQAWEIDPVTYPPVGAVQRLRRSFRSDIRPLRILSNQVWKSLQNDVWLANAFAGTVRRAHLPNGDDMLFIAGESAPPAVSAETAATIAQAVAYSKSLHDEATRLGLRYLAVLLPVKTAVYQHLQESPAATAVPPGMVTETERQLTAAGIQVLDLFAPLTARAGRVFSSRQYVYWRDDTHWSPAGIATAAEAIAGALAQGGVDAR